MGQHVFHGEDQVVDGQFLVLQGLLAREGKHALCEIGTFFSSFGGSANALGGTFVMFHQIFDKLQIAHDHHEQIVEVMGYAASELTNSLHLLRLLIFALQGLAFGYTLAAAKNAFDVALRVKLRLHGHFKPGLLTRAQFNRDFEVFDMLSQLCQFERFAKPLLVGGIYNLDKTFECGMNHGISHADKICHF